MSDIAGSTEFKITNTILHVLIVSFSTKDNVKLTKKIKFKRPVYWNEHQAKTESKDLNDQNLTRVYPGASFQVVKRLFVSAFGNSNNIERSNYR